MGLLRNFVHLSLTMKGNFLKYLLTVWYFSQGVDQKLLVMKGLEGSFSSLNVADVHYKSLTHDLPNKKKKA